ncbi:Rieske (2Fe-2S) protein [Streptomyces corynorhini]|uniref:Cytochrome bc1 complex Rieske iron-sulfur subunit n=1 Tax=Streptomyces corynorhini TaxID=2282652 RepID=A0A370BKH1_9ACTN|nr:Rieske (2Fe-2S) protein [Streptomyces corynorhini]RDG39835.1 Rieske (2Fe-2S) protein [Streptomyces corynorhini]
MKGTYGTARVVTRRTLVAAAGAAGLGAALVACGSEDAADANGGGGSSGSGSAEGSGGSDGTAGSGDGQPESGGGSGDALTETTDIPEGGGKVFADQGVVVTQPSPGEFKAFSSKCTHTGCAVKDVSDGTIHCPCHGSKFSAADGSVQAGPATTPLPAASIKVSGTSITLA